MAEDSRHVPAAGQAPGRLDRMAPAAAMAALVLTTAGFLMAFLMVPPVEGASVSGAEQIGGALISNRLLLSQKIFFFHMPVAIVSFGALVFAGYYSIRFLMTRDARYDARARIAMEIALLFVAMTMITGEMWTRFEWGVWWTWDPRLTTYLILMLIVLAYMVLRAMVDDPERRGSYAAVLAILALVDVPICLMITRMIPSSVHPVVVRQGGMSPEMGICVGIILLGMAALGFALYRARLRQVLLGQRVELAKEQLEALESRKRASDLSEGLESLSGE